jgi:ribosomal protein S18 acetylase RimI-like enzyme
MSLYDVAFGKANVKDIQQHLERCSDNFVPTLDSYVNIYEYSEKIVSNAETFEVWHEERLVALVAIYLNDPTRQNAYITNVSVENNFQGKGLAKTLLDSAIKKATLLNFKAICLRVKSNNEKAFRLYILMGFIIDKKDNVKPEFIEMKKVL